MIEPTIKIVKVEKRRNTFFLKQFGPYCQVCGSRIGRLDPYFVVCGHVILNEHVGFLDRFHYIACKDCCKDEKK